jgi:hypothetical protein
MHAAALEEELVLEELEFCVPTVALETAAAPSEAAGDFTSSFFHIGHLDIENGIFEVAHRRAGWELRLESLNILQHLEAVNKNDR